MAAIRAGGRRSYSLKQNLTIGEFQRTIELRGTFLFPQGESPPGERGSSGGEGPLGGRVPWGTR